MFLEDLCVHSLSNRPEWLLFLFCQINRHFPDSKCDFFSSQTAHFLGISPGRSIHYQILQVCQNFNSPNSECIWPGLEFLIKVKSKHRNNGKTWKQMKMWKWSLCEGNTKMWPQLPKSAGSNDVEKSLLTMSKQRNLNGWLWFHGHSVPRST